MYRLYSAEAIVLGGRDASEADRFIYFYTREFGRIGAVAKGVRLEKSKLRGSLDVFSHANIGFVIGHELYRLTSADLVWQFPGVRKDSYRFEAASALLRFMKEMVHGEEPDESLWQLLLAAFYALDKDDISKEQTVLLLYAFQIKALDCLGYLPGTENSRIRLFQTSPTLLFDVLLSEHERREILSFLADAYLHIQKIGKPDDFFLR